jgi:hypothetical protein
MLDEGVARLGAGIGGAFDACVPAAFAACVRNHTRAVPDFARA